MLSKFYNIITSTRSFAIMIHVKGY